MRVSQRVRNLLKVLQWLECHSDLGWLFYRWKTKLTELRFFMLGCIFLQTLEADSSVEDWWRPGGPFSTLKALIIMIDSRTMTPYSCLPRAATPDVTKQLVKGSSCLFHARAWRLLLGLEFPLNPQIGWVGCEGLRGLHYEMGTTGQKECFEGLPLKMSCDVSWGLSFRGSVEKKTMIKITYSALTVSW